MQALYEITRCRLYTREMQALHEITRCRLYTRESVCHEVSYFIKRKKTRKLLLKSFIKVLKKKRKEKGGKDFYAFYNLYKGYFS